MKFTVTREDNETTASLMDALVVPHTECAINHIDARLTFNGANALVSVDILGVEWCSIDPDDNEHEWYYLDEMSANDRANMSDEMSSHIDMLVAMARWFIWDCCEFIGVFSAWNDYRHAL